MSGEEPGPSALLSDLASLPGLRASVQQVVGSASSLPDESSVALFKQLLAHYYAAEDRGRYLERQLCAVSDIVQIQEVMHTATANSMPGLRASVQKIVDKASNLPNESSVALYKQLAEQEIKIESLRRQLAGCEEKERAARKGYARAAQLLQSSLESASRAQLEAAESSAAREKELSLALERARVSDSARQKAESDSVAQRESCQRLVKLVEQLERRQKDHVATMEQSDVERLHMERALEQMQGELHQLKIESSAMQVVKGRRRRVIRKATSTRVQRDPSPS